VKHGAWSVKQEKGFTLVEVLISFSIFVVIAGLVLIVIVTAFRSFNQGQKMAERQQKKRVAFFWLGKELSSLTRISYPGSYFKGDDKGFFLSSIRRIVWQNAAIPIIFQPSY